jgi:hypothetical protein
MSARTYRALLIANSTFPTPRTCPTSRPPQRSGAFARALRGSAGLFPSDNIRLVTERTMAEVLRDGGLPQQRVAAGRCSCTTAATACSTNGELFLCTRDSRADRLRSTAVRPRTYLG